MDDHLRMMGFPLDRKLMERGRQQQRRWQEERKWRHFIIVNVHVERQAATSGGFAGNTLHNT